VVVAVVVIFVAFVVVVALVVGVVVVLVVGVVGVVGVVVVVVVVAVVVAAVGVVVGVGVGVVGGLVVGVGFVQCTEQGGLDRWFVVLVAVFVVGVIAMVAVGLDLLSFVASLPCPVGQTRLLLVLLVLLQGRIDRWTQVFGDAAFRFVFENAPVAWCLGIVALTCGRCAAMFAFGEEMRIEATITGGETLSGVTAVEGSLCALVCGFEEN
jgi:hypothetical protein